MMKGNLQKLPSLDGWRMVSITLVLLAHCGYTSGFPIKLADAVIELNLGNLGVRFFFVISGFLITWLLLQEQDKNGFISLKKFYVRRVLRIFPVYFLYLCVLGFLTRYSQPSSEWIANLTFTSDFFPTTFPTVHLWSLGVEEQFYVLWPWLLIQAMKRGESGFRLLKILMVPLLIAPIVRMMGCKQWYPDVLHWAFQGDSFFWRFDSLAYGCLMAVLITHWRKPLELFYQTNSRRITCTGTALLLAPALFYFLHIPARLQVASSDSIQGVGFSLLMVQSILHPNLAFYRFLNWKWVAHLGVLSYSIYIWQQMFCGTGQTVFGVKDAWWSNFPLWILAALLTAHLSYYLVEKPLLRLRARFRSA